MLLTASCAVVCVTACIETVESIDVESIDIVEKGCVGGGS